jgi:hypothetical protein
MTREEMLVELGKRTGESDGDVLASYLDEAGQAIIERAYPFRDDVTEVPVRYQRKQIEIATYLLNKRGAEGETKHDENGTNRTYESASVPNSMLYGIMPFASIPNPVREEENENP